MSLFAKASKMSVKWSFWLKNSLEFFGPWVFWKRSNKKPGVNSSLNLNWNTTFSPLESFVHAIHSADDLNVFVFLEGYDFLLIHSWMFYIMPTLRKTFWMHLNCSFYYLLQVLLVENGPLLRQRAGRQCWVITHKNSSQSFFLCRMREMPCEK